MAKTNNVDFDNYDADEDDLDTDTVFIWTHQNNTNEEVDESEAKIYAERPNKQLLKRQVEINKNLVRELIALTPNELSKLTLPENLLDNILETKRVMKSHVAFKRQLQYTTRILISDENTAEDIHQQLKQLHKPSRKAVKQLQQITQWRDDLLQGDNELQEQLATQFIHFERQYVRQLVRNAQKEAAKKKPPKAAKQLLEYLQNLAQSE